MKEKRKKKEIDHSAKRIIGVDGEGYDLHDPACATWNEGECDCSPKHLYIYLAAVDELGRTVAEAHNPAGLTHEECAALLLSLPKDAIVFGFMFSYDTTKILEDLSISDVYYLMRPQLRDERYCTECRKAVPGDTAFCKRCGGIEIKRRSKPVKIRGRNYDYFNGSLTISERGRRIKVWDCFRFFACAFVEAIKDWKIGTEEQWARISEMKGKRGSFVSSEIEQIKSYCREECHLLALMMRKVIEAHDLAGIPLKHFYGAGSTASALLTLHDVARYKGPPQRDLEAHLAHAVASAFFGGRFEDSVVGMIEQEVFGFDISSAYPFAQSDLPCLGCGTWRFEERPTIEEIRDARLAVASFRVRKISDRARADLAWCPLPFRGRDGSIAYGTNCRGWAWGPEILAALEGWPDLVDLEAYDPKTQIGGAWIYETECDHRPFAFVPEGYRTRIKWGKEGAGKAMKLGLNAGYGKTAQSIGDDPPFQSWIWAGMTTATTRAQILRAIMTAEDRWRIYTIATDGIYSGEDLPIGPPPRDTGTSDLLKDGKPCPLGGWERKVIPGGVFVAKPGLYYSLESAKLSEIRARGVGRREVFAARQKLEEGFLEWDRKDPKFNVELSSRRFYGAKHSILARSRCACGTSWPGVPEQCCPKCVSCSSCGASWPKVPDRVCPKCGGVGIGSVGIEFHTSMVEDANGKTAYGRWAPRAVRIGFDPFPKRERGLSRRGKSSRLVVRDLGGATSKPYDVGSPAPKTTPEGEAQRLAREFAMDQPDYEGAITG